MVGYRLRREFYTDDFSNGIENIAVDFAGRIQLAGVRAHGQAQGSALERLAATRHRQAAQPRPGTRLPGSRMRPAAWCGRSSATMRSCRSRTTACGPPNRVEVRPAEEPTAGNPSASPPMPWCRSPAPAGSFRSAPARSAMTKVVYRVLASSFQDGSEMETGRPRSILMRFAYRWGERVGRRDLRSGDRRRDQPDARALQGRPRRRRGGNQDPDRRSRLHLSFANRGGLSRRHLRPTSIENALVAPPWSSVPWHVLALMEAAVERGIAAFSQSEAQAAQRAVARSRARSGAAREAARADQGIRREPATDRRRSKAWSARKPPRRAGRRSINSSKPKATCS